MKCLLLALILGSTLCLINAAQTTTPDYREKYDHLWLEWVNERIREGERFLERLNVELNEFKAKPTEDLRKRIESQVQATLADVKISLSRFETELKAPGLDLLERYTLEKAKAEGENVIKIMNDILKTVVKKP